MDKLCAFPGCKKLGDSRGTNKKSGGVKRFKWCNYHRRGKVKIDRLKINKEYL